MRPSRGPFLTVLIVVLLLLHGLPWWRLVLAPQWPTAATVAGTVLAVVALVGFPLAMFKGHGKAHHDGLAVLGDSWLGIIWQLFVWTIVGELLDLILAITGMHGPERNRWTAGVVLVWTALICGWGLWQARRIPPVRTVEIPMPRLGAGLDGLRLVMIADTHFGPINRARWSAGVVQRVNTLDPEILAHAGDLADGSVEMRRLQVAPLGNAEASLAKVYITGNHEYMSGAADWVTHMDGLGWTVLRNGHLIVERGGSRLAVAGIDDLTAKASGVPGHGADLDGALAGLDPDLPILLLAHQPKSVRMSAPAGVDLQISGHTHGGQMWPFHHIVRLEQGAVAGLSRHGERTMLYTSRGSGFWGPPFRIFAPNEITLLILRSSVPSNG
ncbi:putative MPP superfamily phosphohydrolase [Nakamurella sp. UYEF19]|uniref:metallophosphoesterase n=1 Tax=Nakamurella sp. UYEF19 TaxID=1756392 RepID=UPI0033921EB4